MENADEEIAPWKSSRLRIKTPGMPGSGPSERGRFIAWIAVAKRAATRTRRLAESIALLERGERLGMR